MDPQAYLKRHGWLGLGHSLDPEGRGIPKPLLISRKENVLGIGTKKNDIFADQWWSRAFDSSLQNLEVNKIESTGTTVAVKGDSIASLELLKAGAGKWIGLYSGFVRGQGLEGTISPEEKHSRNISPETNDPEPNLATKREKKSRKRKRQNPPQTTQLSTTDESTQLDQTPEATEEKLGRNMTPEVKDPEPILATKSSKKSRKRKRENPQTTQPSTTDEPAQVEQTPAATESVALETKPLFFSDYTGSQTILDEIPKTEPIQEENPEKKQKKAGRPPWREQRRRDSKAKKDAKKAKKGAKVRTMTSEGSAKARRWAKKLKKREKGK